MTPDASPHDWTEDFADDNGCYMHTCYQCKQTFTGHKRRAPLCKACHDAGEAEATRRAQWLHEHGAPEDWVIYTVDERHAQIRETFDLIHQLHVERRVRDGLVETLTAIAERTDMLIHQSQGRFDWSNPHNRRVLNVSEGNVKMAREAVEKAARLEKERRRE